MGKISSEESLEGTEERGEKKREGVNGKGGDEGLLQEGPEISFVIKANKERYERKVNMKGNNNPERG